MAACAQPPTPELQLTMLKLSQVTSWKPLPFYYFLLAAGAMLKNTTSQGTETYRILPFEASTGLYYEYQDRSFAAAKLEADVMKKKKAIYVLCACMRECSISCLGYF